MSPRALFLLAPLIMASLAGCEVPPSQYSVAASPPKRDPLLTPREVVPGRLEYARQPDTFAPVLTQRVAYPTQVQANYAFERFSMAAETPFSNPLVVRAAEPHPFDRRAVRIRLLPADLARSTTRREGSR
jgi:hypothetical protein